MAVVAAAPRALPWSARPRTLDDVTPGPVDSSNDNIGDRRVMLSLSWSSGEPAARIRRLPTGDSGSQEPGDVVDASLRGLELAYRIVNGRPRHCLGSGGSVTACDSPVQRGSKRCARCSVSEALHASSLHHAHNRDPVAIDPEVRRHLDQPNDLYLAAFRDGSIKVGTSSSWRTEERLTEQGAWLASVVARTSDGYDIRILEDAVTNHLGVPQSVSTSRKMSGLTRPVDDATLAAKLSAATRDVRALPDFDQLTLADVETRRWENQEAMSGPFAGKLHPYPHRLDQGAHDLQIVDLCGRVAAAVPNATDDVLAVDLGQLFGVEQEVGHFDTDEIALQGSLF